jgi:hypothetical protein
MKFIPSSFFISNFQWFYTTSKFAKYIKSITKIIQVWLLCIWKVISLSLLCIIYKPVIVKCVVKEILCSVKFWNSWVFVLLFRSLARCCYYFTWGSPKNRIFFAWKYVSNEFKKKKFSYHYKIMLLLKHAK